MKSKKYTDEVGIPMKSFVEEKEKRDIEMEFIRLSEVSLLKQHKLRLNKDKDVYSLNRYIDILPCNLLQIYIYFKLYFHQL
jgi:hypothetical protein